MTFSAQGERFPLPCYHESLPKSLALQVFESVYVMYFYRRICLAANLAFFSSQSIYKTCTCKVFNIALNFILIVVKCLFLPLKALIVKYSDTFNSFGICELDGKILATSVL